MKIRSKFKKKANQAFTILELIIVIIIVAVLASIALPRFLNLIEFTRSAEALNSFIAIRQAMERCYFMSSDNLFGARYYDCNTSTEYGWNVLTLDDPSLSPGAHFTYSISTMGGTVDEWTAFNGDPEFAYLAGWRNEFMSRVGTWNLSEIILQIYHVVARRNTLDSGDTNDTIQLYSFKNAIGMFGTGRFRGLKQFY